jgi:hypothetical protein
MAGRRRAKFRIAGLDYLLPFSKFGQASAPTAMDDELDGFTNGSFWFTTADDMYWCADPTTGAAVWVLIASGLGLGAAYSVTGVAGGSPATRADIAATGTTAAILSLQYGDGEVIWVHAPPTGGVPYSDGDFVFWAASLGVPFGGTGAASHTDGALLVGNGTDPIESSAVLTQTTDGLSISKDGGSSLILDTDDGNRNEILFQEDGVTKALLQVNHDAGEVTFDSGYTFDFTTTSATRIRFSPSTTSSNPAIRVYDSSNVVRASISGTGVVDAEAFIGDGSGLTDVSVDLANIEAIDTGLLGNNTGAVQAPIRLTASQVQTMLGLGTLAYVDDPTTTENDLIVRDSGGLLARSTLTALLDTLFGATRGTIMYRGAAGWAGLAPSTVGYKLQTNGTGADPSWVAVSGGSGSYLVTLSSVVAQTG